MQYDNFDLHIQEKDSDCYKVTVLPLRGAEECLGEEIFSEVMKRDLDRLEESFNHETPEDLLSEIERGQGSIDAALIKKFGHTLHECLFRGSIRDAYNEAF